MPQNASLEFFARLLAEQKPRTADLESFWDARAQRFERSKRTYGDALTKKVLGYLVEQGCLNEESRVLDIGCAGGRYAVPLAKIARAVVGMDISERMLELCAERAKAEDISNLACVKGDWEAPDPGGLAAEEPFDLVFAAMCPVLNTPVALERMSARSRGHCVIAQYIAIRDPLAEKLRARMGVAGGKDPHNGRDVAWAIFNILWLLGYNPGMAYLQRSEDRDLGIGEAAERYALSLGDAAAAKDIGLADLLREFAEGDTIRVQTETTLALIRWQIKREEK